MYFAAIFDKEVIIRKDNEMLSTADFEKIKSSNPVAEYFEEKQNDLQVLALLSKDNLPEEYKAIYLREFYSTHSVEENFLTFRAKALFSWHGEAKYCGACGTKLIPHSKLTAMECPSCHKILFPRIEPCVIVLNTKGDKI